MAIKINIDRFNIIMREADGMPHFLVKEPKCRLCGLPILPAYAGNGKCFSCSRGSKIDGHILSKVIPSTLYVQHGTPSDFPHAKEILELKKDGRHAIAYAEVLADLIRKDGIKTGPKTMVIPVPKDYGTEDYPGHYHLAYELGNKLDIIVGDALVKTRITKKQKNLDAAERNSNVKGSVDTKYNFAGYGILLVDDILTTGNTMSEAAKVIKDRGATWVVGVVAGKNVQISHLRLVGAVTDV